MCSSQAIGRLERNYSDLPSYKKNSEINQSWDMFILVILHTLKSVLPGQFCPKSPILVSKITKFPTVLAQNHGKITRFLTKTTNIGHFFLHFYVTIFLKIKISKLSGKYFFRKFFELFVKEFQLSLWKTFVEKCWKITNFSRNGLKFPKFCPMSEITKKSLVICTKILSPIGLQKSRTWW